MGCISKPAKPHFSGAEQVYRYLGRYTHRVAFSRTIHTLIAGCAVL
jgi:hypothetical protein